LTGEDIGNVQVAFFDARCGRPPVTWQELTSHFPRLSDYEHILIIGDCCLMNLKQQLPKIDNCSIRHLMQCFYVFADQRIIDSYLNKGGYLVTSGWLANWRDWMEHWGLDQPTASSFFNESANKIVLLDTWVDQEIKNHLQEFSAYVDLPTETFQAGLDFFKLYLKNIITEWRQENHNRELMVDLRKAQSQASDLAMALELLSKLSQSSMESQVVNGVMELFTLLCAPKKIFFHSFQSSKLSVPPSCCLPPSSLKEIKGNGFLWTESKNGFWLYVQTQDIPIGLLEIDHIAFPAFRNHYLNLALSISSVCGLLINNVRIAQELRESEEKFRGLFNDAHDMIHIVDSNGRIIDANPVELKTMDYSRKEYIGKPFYEVIHPDYMELTQKSVEAVLSGENIN